MSWACPSMSLRVAEVSRRAARPASAVELQQDLVGKREQRVADQDRLGRAVHLPHRVAVAPLLVAVHQVVVQQREVVHELDGHGAGDAGLRGGAGRLRGQQGQRRAHGLAAVAVGGPALGIDPAEVVGGHGVHGRCEPVNGSPEHRRGKGPSALQKRGDVRGVRHGVGSRIRRGH